MTPPTPQPFVMTKKQGEVTEETLQGISQMGMMAAQLMRSMTENGMERDEALYIVKEWFIATVQNAGKKKGSDSITEALLKIHQPKKQ